MYFLEFLSHMQQTDGKLENRVHDTEDVIIFAHKQAKYLLLSRERIGTPNSGEDRDTAVPRSYGQCNIHFVWYAIWLESSALNCSAQLTDWNIRLEHFPISRMKVSQPTTFMMLATQQDQHQVTYM